MKPRHTEGRVSASKILLKFPFKMKRQVYSKNFFIEKNLSVIFSNQMMKIRTLWVAGNIHPAVHAINCDWFKFTRWLKLFAWTKSAKKYTVCDRSFYLMALSEDKERCRPCVETLPSDIDVTVYNWVLKTNSFDFSKLHEYMTFRAIRQETC